MATKKTHKSSGSRRTSSTSKPRTSAASKPKSTAKTTAAEPKAPEKPAAEAKDTAVQAAKASEAKATEAVEKAAPKAAAAKAEPVATAKAAAPAKKTTTTKKAAAKPEPKAAPKPEAVTKKPEAKAAKPAPKAEPKAEKVPEPKPTAAKPAPKSEPVAKEAAKPEPEAKPEPAKKPEDKAPTPEAKVEKPKAAPAPEPEPEPEPAPKPAPEPEPEPEPAPEPEPEPKPTPEPAPVKEPEPAAKEKEETVTDETPTPQEEPEEIPAEPLPEPRRSIAFIGSECYPFVKTGGLGDVMYALPKALIPQNCDVKVILPKYACIKDEWKEKMVYRGAFDMDLCSDGTKYYVGIMEYVSDDGVVYDFIDNEWFFNSGNPYTNLIDDIPKYCYFAKAALAALNYLDWIPDIIHCHDWQASLVPIYLKTMFQDTPLGHAKSILTIHNLRFQGKYDIRTIQYWSGLPSYVFNEGALQENWTDANMLKGGLAYADMITTVSGTYAAEIQTGEYGEGLDAHLRYHSGKLRGIVNGIDYGIWNPAEDKLIEAPYSSEDVLEKKRQDKAALQKELGLEEDTDKMVIGLISRLTNQKGLDLVNDIFQQLLDGNTQVVILGTGEPQYEDSFRWFENNNKGTVCSNIMYDEARSHQIYAGADALLVPSRFEPCGLTQLIAMHYGTVPVVRETGGLKDTVQPYNKYTNEGNGFTFDRYESGLLLDAINRAKTLYFTDRLNWDRMVVRDMEKDVSWANSAKQYRQLYVDLTC